MEKKIEKQKTIGKKQKKTQRKRIFINPLKNSERERKRERVQMSEREKKIIEK